MLIGFPLKSLLSSPAMAARASWPSISTKPKPRHFPENTSVISLIERTVPNSANSSLTDSSFASGVRLPTNSVFNSSPLYKYINNNLIQKALAPSDQVLNGRWHRKVDANKRQRNLRCHNVGVLVVGNPLDGDYLVT